MNKHLVTVVFFLVGLFSFRDVPGQTDPVPLMKTFRIGIFAPLYLDSIFNEEGKFRYKQGMPKFIMPGVDFINGAQIALDSLRIDNNQVNATIYDTKSYSEPVDQLIRSQRLDSLDLLIGSVKDQEYKQLAEFALAKKIPFISATYPNDGGITNNPYVVLLNSTLKSHCEGIFSFILQKHGTDDIILVRKKGAQEDKVAGYFKAINEPDKQPLLKIQTINMDSTFSSDLLKKKLDTSRQSIIIGASLDEQFATTLTSACYDLHDYYPIILVGMPNWDGFKNLTRTDRFIDFPVYFTSPFFANPADNLGKVLTAGYTRKYKARPNDMVFKGFESTYLFTRLLCQFDKDLLEHINDKTFKVFSDYNFRPVLSGPADDSPDYIENKHLYFIRIMNSTMIKAW